MGRSSFRGDKEALELKRMQEELSNSSVETQRKSFCLEGSLRAMAHLPTLDTDKKVSILDMCTYMHLY